MKAETQRMKGVMARSFLVLALFAIAGFSNAMYELELKDLVGESEKIVQAKVTAIVPQASKDGKMIYTYVRMNIEDDLIADDEDNEIIVKTIGGTVNGTTLSVEGTAAYTVGEDNILFLYQDPANKTVSRTLGMFQGKYRIYQDENKVDRVSQDTTAHVTMLKKYAAGPQAPSIKGNRMSLREFKTAILELLKNK